MAEPKEYKLGSLVRVTATFKNDAGALADPTTVRFKVKRPDDTKETVTYLDAGAGIVKTGTGVYYKEYTVNQSGTWHFGTVGSGALVAVNDDTIRVLEDPTE